MVQLKAQGHQMLPSLSDHDSICSNQKDFVSKVQILHSHDSNGMEPVFLLNQ
jgi:hypothetical protein